MEKKSNKTIIIGITSIFLITLILIGITYAYYRTRIIGNESTDQSISVTSKTLEITYADKTPDINLSNLKPGVTVSKTFSVKNTGDGTVNNFGVYLNDVVNELDFYKDLKMSISCQVINEKGNFYDYCEGHETIRKYPKKNEILVIDSIDAGMTNKYTIEIEYVDTGVDQSDDMNKLVSGTIKIVDSSEIMNLSFTNDEYVLKRLYHLNLELGDEIKYDPQVDKDIYSGKFKLLGIDEGKIILLSDSVGELTLTGKNGFETGITEMNTKAQIYGYGEHATKARSLKAEDINEITGYDPLYTPLGGPAYKDGSDEYGTTATYSIKNGYLIVNNKDNNYYSDGTSHDTRTFKKYDGTYLQEGETYDVQSNYYWYPASPNGKEEASGDTVHMYIDQKVYDMLRHPSQEQGKGYWLANQSILPVPWGASWGMMFLINGNGTAGLSRNFLYNSRRDDLSLTYEVRAVVYLEPSISFSWNSSNNNWEIN